MQLKRLQESIKSIFLKIKKNYYNIELKIIL